MNNGTHGTTKQFNIRLAAETKEQLDRAADAAGCDVSSLVRECIELALADVVKQHIDERMKKFGEWKKLKSRV